MANNFSPNDGSKVPLSEAQKWMKKFDDEDRHDKKKDTESIFFGREFLKSILEVPECAGISIFLAKKHSDHAQKDVINVVLIPRKEDGTLIYTTIAEGKDGTTPVVYDTGKLCPPTCN